MIVTITKDEVLNGFMKAASIVPVKAGAQYLRSIWIQAKQDDTVTVMATDVNIEFTGTYKARVEEPGEVGINGKALVELIRRLPSGDIKLRLDKENNCLLVEQGRRSYKLPVADPVWFQLLPPFPEEGAVLWVGDYFQELIEKVGFCISDDQEVLSCIYLKSVENGKVDVCGLNGHQFAITSFVNDEIAKKIGEEGLLLQKKYIVEIKKWLNDDEIYFNFTERRFHIKNKDGSEHISVPRTMAQYPDYRLFINKLNADDASKLTVNKRNTMEALDRIYIFNNENDRCTYFNLSGNMAILSAQAQETGSASEELDLTYNGSIEKIAFPTKNLMEILGHFQSADLEWTLTTAEGPCGITGTEDPDYMVLIMPMKITQSSYYEE